jgi:tetratricopeptide (TPR) repeat protein
MWISSLGRRGRLGLLAVFLLSLVAVAVVLQGGYYRATYHLQAARKALDHDDYVTAETHLKRCLQFRPDSAEGHFLLARLTRRAGHPSEAAEHLEASRSLGWSDDAVCLETVLAQVQQGQFVGTVENYLQRRLSNHESDRFLVCEALSQGYMKTYQLSKAFGCLNKMLEQQPDNVYALLRRGWILEWSNRFEEAEKDYRRAVASQPDHVLAHHRLAENLLLHAKKMAEAAEHFEAVIRLRPDDVTAEVNLAKCWREMGRLDEARTLLDQLLAAHPNVATALLERGQLAMSEGQHEQAENWLRRSLELQPHSATGNYTLYLCLTQQGKAAEADHYLARFKAVEADDKRMAKLLQRVNEAPDPALRCEAALIFFRAGEDQEGERWLFMALQADPTYRPAHEALAAYYERTGRTEQAESHRRLAQPSDATDPASVSLTRP